LGCAPRTRRRRFARSIRLDRSPDRPERSLRFFRKTPR